MSTSTETEINDLKKFMEEYARALGASAETIAEVATGVMASKLLQISKSYQWQQYSSQYTSSLSGLGQQTSLMSMRDLTKALSKMLGKSVAAAAMLKAIYDDWTNGGLPEETAKTTAALAIGAMIGTAIAGTGVMAIAGTAILAGIAGYLIDVAYDITVDISEDFFTKLFEKYPSLATDLPDISRIISSIDGSFSTAEITRSPLILDLDGDGVETIGKENGIYFDHNNNSFAEKSGWVGKDDGVLVYDRNGNGKIDNGLELFGNNTIMSNGQKADNGFEALKDLDSNKDGVFDASDAAFNNVKVWKDANGNGKLDEGELLTLEEAGVSAINLNYNNQDLTDENGNQHLQTGSFVDTNGNIKQISDVWFDTNPADTKTDVSVVIPENIKDLPNIAGSGNVYDLHTAMSLDSTGTLKQLVEQYIAETNNETRQGILVNIIYHWAGVQNMDPNGRNPTQIYGNVLGDSRKLEALEEFLGKDYLGTWCWGERDPNPHGHAAPLLLRAFDELCDYVGEQILIQTACKPFLENIFVEYDISNGLFSVDVSEAVNMLQSMYNSNPDLALSNLLTLSKYFYSLDDEIANQVISAFRNSGSPEGNLIENKLVDFAILSNMGTSGSDTLKGGDGDDIIQGFEGNDKIYGNGGNDQLYGNEGNDTIFGDAGDDLLVGGAGNDYLSGGDGADTYYFELGFGNDSIYNNNNDVQGTNADRVLFGEGINSTDITLQREGFDLILKTSTNDSLRIYSYFDQQGQSSATVETIEFTDGTVWNYDYILAAWNSAPSAGGGRIIDGGSGNDTLTGTAYDDIISGNKGDDTISAGAGNDVISGGKGNDYLAGGAGNDSYYYNLGDGFDTISDSGNNDRIVFGPGINFSSLTFSYESGDLKIVINGDQSQGMLIKYFFSDTNYKIENLVFNNGSVVHLSEIGLTLKQSNLSETIKGTTNNDIIYGNGGNDTISAGAGHDTIIGGKGDDDLQGEAGNDTYIWNLGDGFDTIRDTEGTDKIVFGQGISFSDLVFERKNNDLYIYVGNNKTQGMKITYQFDSSSSYAARIETLEFVDGFTFNMTNSGFTFTQTDDNDSVSGTAYNDTIYGNGGNDTINAGAGNDTIIGGKGNDTLDGDAGDDTYIWNLGDGFDTISENGGTDKIVFSNGITFDDLTFEHDSNYTLYIYVKGDKTQGIKIYSQFNSSSSYSSRIETLEFADGSTFNMTNSGFTFTQTDSNDSISGTAYDDTIYGNGGNDTISAGSGNDVIIGGKGDDTLDGAAGDDTYIWNLGDGFDTISENGGNDKIVFGEGITFDDLTFERDSNYALSIYVKGDKTQGIKIYSQFNSSSSYYGRIETLEFADGSTFNMTNTGFTFTQSESDESISGTSYNDTIYGNGGNDTINAGNGNDVIIGGKGNDALNGEAGDDTYIWNLGDGFDTIYDNSGNDKIILGEGITFEDLSFERNGYELRIYVKNDKTQGFAISSQFYSSSYQIETLEFADGSTLNLITSGFTFNQTDADESITGTAYDDIIYGNGGNDTINAGNGNDIIYGGLGNDSISGGLGDDIIVGGEGNDALYGEAGNDTYLWNLGDGFDTITDSSGNDKIVIGEGVTFDNLIFEKDGNNLQIYVNGDKSQGFSIVNYFYTSSYKNKIIEFADGSTFNLATSGLTLTQTNGENNISGTSYNDIIYGNGGNDTISAGSGDDLIYGGNGNDTIYGGNGNDTIIGGKDNDNLMGDSGNDTYIWNLGDGFDTINDNSGSEKIVLGEGIAFENLTFSKNGNDLHIYVNGDYNQGLSIYNYFYTSSYKNKVIEFAYGSTFNLATSGLTLIQTNGDESISGTAYDDIIYANAGNDTVNAGSGNDIIYGGAGSDTINAENGDDTIIGGLDNDILDGGAGNDTYIWNSGDGFDTIKDNSGNDKIVFGSGINLANLTFEKSNNDLNIYVNNDKTQGISIYNYYSSSSYRTKTIEFANGSTLDLRTIIDAPNEVLPQTINGTYGNDTLIGGDGNDTINASDGDDIIIGGKGDDKLYGSYDNDTYIYNLGDGFDTIYEDRGNDKIVFGTGISLENLSFRRKDDHLIIYINGDLRQGMMIDRYFDGNQYKVETIEFADGNTFNLSTSGLTFTQSDTGESITATSYDDVIYGNGGDDTINAGHGNDTLIGGTGNDKLNGGSGNDTYIWNLGDGFDTITDTSGKDKLVFGTDITFENLTFENKGDNLNIYINGDHNQGVSIYSFFYNSDNRIETIEFADGSTFKLDSSGLTFIQDDNNETIRGTAYNDIIYANGGNDTINSYNGNDIIYGGDGNDTINAGNGNDILIGGAGNDTLYGDSGDDTYIWNLGDGFDTISDDLGQNKIIFGEGIAFESLSFETVENHLNIYVNGDKTQGISIINFFYNNSYKINDLEFADGSIFNLLREGLTLVQRDGSETISGTGYDDIIYANGGDDTVNAGNGNDKIYGGDGNDTINAGAGNDILIGGAGNDILYGESGDDTYIWNLGDGFDTITDSSGQNKIILGDGITFDDLSFERKDNYLNIYVKNDKTQGISITNFFYNSDYKISEIEFADGSVFNLSTSGLVLNQTDMDDNISATAYDDVIYGNGGKDTISAGSGDDTLIGGAGNDNLSGGSGDDTYVWNLGDDFDTISESSGNDRILFGEGISLENLSFERIDNNLIIYVNNDKTQGMVINNHFQSSYDYGVEIIEFADGSSISTSVISLEFEGNDAGQTINGTDFNDIIKGGIGNDTLNGNDGEDVLIGGKGNDILQGGYGRDTYIYNLGDGFDTITDVRGEDKIVFGAGINPSDISFRQVGSHLIISIGSDANQGIKITDFYSNVHNKVEFIEFANGTVLSIADRGITLNQTNAHDNVSGTSYDDIIYGRGGNDTILGNAGNDRLIGGTGNDILQGGTGNDTYVWNLGDGMDTITETSGDDKILFGSGISYSNLKFAQDGKDLIIIVNNDVNQGMRIVDFYRYDDNKVETLQFANGTTRALSGVTLTDNDNLYMYSLNSGLAVINETGGNNAIQFSEGITMNSLSFARDDTDSLVITFADNETDGIKITDFFKSEENQVQTLIFADNTEFDLSQVAIQDTTAAPETPSNIIESSASTINGTTEDDLIYSQSNGIVTVNGGDGDDIITAGHGINTINGGNGNDIMSAGNGINTFNAWAGDDIINTGNGINTVHAGDGNDIIRTGNGINTIFGGAGNDMIYTGNGINETTGGAGNDVIHGGLGGDTYVYNMGDGFDTIFESGGRDTLKFGEGINMSNLSFTSSGNDLTIGVKGDAASGITISDFYKSNSNKVDVLEFSNGQTYDISKYSSADQLIQAMGAFGATSSASTDMTIEELSVVDNVLASSYKNVA